MTGLPHNRRFGRRPSRRRRGTATVELAVCLPALFLLVFGSMQACDMIYLKHSLTTAAYEGSLEVARPDATNASVQARVDQVLAVRGVDQGWVTILSARPIEDTDIGEEVGLRVTAPVAINLMFTSFFGTPSQLQVELYSVR